MSAPVASLASISIDCVDPDGLARFYGRLLHLDEVYARPDRSVVCLGSTGVWVTFLKVEDYAPPAWPDGPQRQQMHLDLATEDLEAAIGEALSLGARQAEHQPSPDRWRVLLDPAGHPFCFSIMRPD